MAIGDLYTEHLISNWILDTRVLDRYADQWVDPTVSQWTSLVSGTLDYIYIRGMQAESWHNEGGYNTICGNDTKVFLGSSTHGIQYINKANVSLDDENPIDLSEYVHTYLVPPDISSFNVKYLHCNDNYLVALTDRGIDTIKYTHPGYIASRLIPDPVNNSLSKGFVVSTGHTYFTLSGTFNWRISKTLSPTDYSYKVAYNIITGDGILDEGLKLNDLYITENTARDHTHNTIFCATSSGAYIIEEDTWDYYVFNGQNNDYNFKSIWADSNTNLNEHRTYIASDYALYILEMHNKKVYSVWKSGIKGIDSRTLSYDDWDGVRINIIPIYDNIVDINKY